MTEEEAVYRRPKGYVKWRPQRKTRVLLDQVNEIFTMYQDNLPLTARQIFYRLVGAYDYDKTELAYNRLCEHLVRARRAGLVPFDYIRDDGTKFTRPGGYVSLDHWWNATEEDTVRYAMYRSLGQPVDIEVWCEAAGMLPQLARVCRPYGVGVYSTSGFSSVTVTHETAQRVVRRGRPTVFLHVGDFDPSGQSIYESMSEDIDTFVLQLKQASTQNDEFNYVTHASGFSYARVALTEEQVEEYDLPTAPPKSSDSRSAKWVGETCQAEAMPPDLLSLTLETTVKEYMDLDVYNDLLNREKLDREKLKRDFRKVQNARKRTGWRE